MIADDPASWSVPEDLKKAAPLVDEEAERKKAEQYEALQKLFRIDGGCADERVYGVPMNGYEAAARDAMAKAFVIPGIEGDDDDATITWDAGN